MATSTASSATKNIINTTLMTLIEQVDLQLGSGEVTLWVKDVRKIALVPAL